MTILKRAASFLYKIHPRAPLNRLFSSTKIDCPTISEKLEAALNKQIQTELDASFAYFSMATYFGRSAVALPGCENYFLKMHREEHEHALVFSNYQNMRGGKVILCAINVPTISDWTIKTAFEVALEMEKCVKQKLCELVGVAEAVKDITAMDIVTTQFLNEQDLSIAELTRILAQYTCMAESGIGRYLFDKLIFKSYIARKLPEKLENYKNVY